LRGLEPRSSIAALFFNQAATAIDDRGYIYFLSRQHLLSIAATFLFMATQTKLMINNPTGFTGLTG
jgi:hypothetical protein